MSKAVYPYPADEFDAPPDPGAPRGVHRAPRSAWSRWWPFLLVIVVVPVLAWGAVTYMAGHGGLPNLAVPGVSDAPSDSTAESPSGSGTPSTPAASTPATSPASSPAVTTPPAGAKVDKSVAVKVTNASGVSGAAAKAAAKLTSAGFTSVTAGNATSSAKQSVVYYATAAQQPAAALVASTLGISTVTQSAAQAGTGITVVLR